MKLHDKKEDARNDADWRPMKDIWYDRSMLRWAIGDKKGLPSGNWVELKRTDLDAEYGDIRRDYEG